MAGAIPIYQSRLFINQRVTIKVQTGSFKRNMQKRSPIIRNRGNFALHSKLVSHFDVRLLSYAAILTHNLVTDPNKENVGASPMQWNSPSMTPPPSFSATKTPVKSDLIKNPFDTNATEHLHLETFSPSVFSRVLSPSEDQDSNWRIEHIAVLNPTEFSPNVHNHFTDPTMEEEAQEKILQFFSQKQIAPSPWSNPRSKVLVRSKLKTPREQSPTITSKNSM